MQAEFPRVAIRAPPDRSNYSVRAQLDTADRALPRRTLSATAAPRGTSTLLLRRLLRLCAQRLSTVAGLSAEGAALG